MSLLTPRLLLTGLALTTCVTLAACSSAPPATTPPAQSPASAAATPESREVSSLNPRLLYAHAGGLVLLDTVTGDVVHSEDRSGFLRLNSAGDGRHIVVTDGDTFRVFDAGIRARGHGDHDHYYESDPQMTAQTFAAPRAGHVVAHDGWTTLFADGTGEIWSMPSDQISDPGPLVRTARTEAPHHGVAVVLADDSLLTTQGTEEARSVVQVLKDGAVVTQTDACPGSHGEAAAKPTEAGDVILVGCSDGPVVYRDGAFHKVTPPDSYARTGNAAGSPVSPVVLTDYKSDKDAEFERPTRVALVDTRTEKLTLVELGSAYWFRSLARGPQGEALVLTYDGHVNVIDPDSGKVTAQIDAVAPWTENTEWQQPGPAIKTAGNFAYVTDAANKKLVVIDLTSKAVTRTFDLAHAPVEIAVATGKPDAHGEADDDHDDHDHSATPHAHG
ncbi:MAG: hypothetical protein QM708_05105 [Propioniciclava sp.]|uniref:hypothetical protein n=1 Tax=Propioniciclava sp. TaxID=2038686 RepID=UPI0039E62DA3